MLPSLRLKLTQAYVALAVVCTVGLGAVGLRLQQQTYLAELDARLDVEVELAAETIATTLAAGQALKPVVERLAAITNTRVTVIDTNRTVLHDTFDAAVLVENQAAQPELIAALADGDSASRRTSASTGEPTAYAVRPITSDGRIVGAVRLGVPMTEINSRLSSILVAIALLTALGAFVACLITVLITRGQSVPMRELTALVRQAATGNFRERVPVRSDDELGQLAESYNQMADQLERTIQATTQQRNELSAILGGISDGIMIVDGSQNVVRINQTALDLFGDDNASAVGRPLIEVSRDHELVAIVERCLVDAQTVRHVIERTQSPRALSVTAAPIVAGDLAGALVTLHDVSELRRLELVRRQFVANVSHELRTPLSTMKLMVETLQEDPSDVALVDDLLGRINGEIDSVTQMVRELLELSKLESGQAPLQREWLALDQIVFDVVERLGPQAERGGVQLSTDSSLRTLTTVFADANRIESVLVNLVHNAIKFTPPGGSVTVGAHGDHEAATIWVRDTGVGIAASDLDRIFERFYKADKARTSGGTGLGLAIAKHTVQAHGGRVWAESVPGQGSTFHFTLPRAVTSPDVAPLAAL